METTTQGSGQVPGMPPPESINQPQAPVTCIGVPSQGLFYEDKKDKFTVEHIIGQDEDIFGDLAAYDDTAQLYRTLLEKKVKDIGFNYDKLLIGDRMFLLLYLRITGYGPYYKVNVRDPFKNEMVLETVDLTKLEFKPIITDGLDEMGRYTSILKDANDEPLYQFTFRLLNIGEIDRISAYANKLKENEVGQTGKKTPTNAFNRTCLIRQIVSMTNIKTGEQFSGDDKITPIINYLPKYLFDDLKEYMDSVEPGINLTYQFISKGSDGDKPFFRNIPFSLAMFYRNLGIPTI
jgi:hypothetical protein